MTCPPSRIVHHIVPMCSSVRVVAVAVVCLYYYIYMMFASVCSVVVRVVRVLLGHHVGLVTIRSRLPSASCNGVWR